MMLFFPATPKSVFTDLAHGCRYFIFGILGMSLARSGNTKLPFCLFGHRWMILSFAALTSIMMRGVLSAWHKRKIFKAIIQNVTIDMVDMLVGSEPSTKMLFHYKSMFKNFSAVIANIFVSMSAYPSSFVGCPPFMEAIARAESSFSKLRRIFLMNLPTIHASTINLDFSHVGIISQIKMVTQWHKIPIQA